MLTILYGIIAASHLITYQGIVSHYQVTMEQTNIAIVDVHVEFMPDIHNPYPNT